jgi:hypothetical protein
MTETMGLVAPLVLALAGGAAFGLIYFRLLRRETARLAQPGAGAGRLLLGLAARMALALGALALAVAAGAGAAHLLAAALGFTLARQLVLRHGAKGR